MCTQSKTKNTFEIFCLTNFQLNFFAHTGLPQGQEKLKNNNKGQKKTGFLKKSQEIRQNF